MTPVVFGPGKPAGRALTFVLISFSGFFAYVWVCWDECQLDRLSPGLILFCGVLCALGVLCWWWQPSRVHVEVDEEGITFQCAGMTLIPNRTLSWDQIAAFGWKHDLGPGNPQCFRIVAHPQGEQTRGRTYDLPLLGFSVYPDAIVAAAVPHMEKAGFRLKSTLREPMFRRALVPVVPIEEAN